MKFYIVQLKIKPDLFLTYEIDDIATFNTPEEAEDGLRVVKSRIRCPYPYPNARILEGNTDDLKVVD